MRYLLSGAVTIIISAALTLPAHAVRQCKPLKKDSRICEVAYDPNDIIELTGVVGAPMTIELAPDEEIPEKGVHVSDIEHVHPGWFPGGHILTLKFVGCLVPEPMTVLTRKGKEDRPYIFQIETTPTSCVTPDMQGPPNQKNGTPLFVSAALAQTAQVPWNMKYLPDNNPNALAAGSTVPYLVKIRYPADAAAVAAKRQREITQNIQTLEAQNLLKVAAQKGTNFQSNRQNLFYANADGDLSLMPSQATDDGYTTTFYFPANQDIPAVDIADNPAQNCGEKADERVKDFSVNGNTMTIPKTAQRWCLRSGNGRVLELWNANYSPPGQNPGTGSVLPNVVREVKGSGDGR